MNESVRFQYFQHQLNARKDNKLSKLLKKEGWQGVGLFWGLLEDLGLEKSHKLECDYEDRAWEMHADASLIKRVVEDYGLFKVKNGYFYSETLITQFEESEEIYKRRREAAAQGGRAKAERERRRREEALHSTANAVPQAENNSANSMPQAAETSADISRYDKSRLDKIEEDNHACYSPSSTAEEKNKHDAVALSNEANANNNDATTESFNFSEEVNDREYLDMTREFMLKYAAAPTQFTDRLIALMAPDQWKGSRGTDYRYQKWRAAAGNIIKVDLPDKYRTGRGGICTKAEREMVDLWLNWMGMAKIYDPEVINSYRGLTVSTQEDGRNLITLFVRTPDDAHLIEDKYITSLSLAIINTVGKNSVLEYKILKPT